MPESLPDNPLAAQSIVGDYPKIYQWLEFNDFQNSSSGQGPVYIQNGTKSKGLTCGIAACL